MRRRFCQLNCRGKHQRQDGALLFFWAITPGPEFRGISRESGPRSPENRSQGLRPPWGYTLHHGEAVQPGGAEAPAGAELRAVAHTQGGRLRCAGRLRAQNGRDRGQGAGAQRKKPSCQGRKRAGLPGNGAQRARFGRQPGRSAGQKPGKTGGCGAETAASGWVLPGKQRGGGAKTAGFGAVGGKKGRKKPPHGGFRAGSGAWHGILRTACDGFTLFSNPAPRTRSPSRLYR